MLLMYDNYLNKELDRIYNKVYKDNALDINKFKELEVVMQNKVINRLLLHFYEDDLILISDIHTELIKTLIYSSKANSYIYLPNNIKVIKSYNNLKLEKITEEIDSYEVEIGKYAHLPNGKNIEVIKESEI